MSEFFYSIGLWISGVLTGILIGLRLATHGLTYSEKVNQARLETARAWRAMGMHYYQEEGNESEAVGCFMEAKLLESMAGNPKAVKYRKRLEMADAADDR